MNKKLVNASMLAATLAVASGTWLSAHHGDAGRYDEKLTTVTGAVVELQLINPHSILVIEVKGKDGALVRWKGEWGSAQGLKREGITRETMKAGDTITMRGRALKNGSPYMTLSECARVIDGTGKELFKGNDPNDVPGQPAASGAGKPDPCLALLR